MMTLKKTVVLAASVLAMTCLDKEMLAAPDPNAPVVSAKTDRTEALYKCGEQATFLISVARAGQPVAQGKVTAVMTLDYGREISRVTLDLGKAPVKVSGTLNEPGFLRCDAAYQVDGKTFKGEAAAGFEPERIVAMAKMPEDLDAFWEAGRKERDAILLDPQLTPLPKFSNAQAESFKVSFANVGDTRIWGFLSVPKGRAGPFPALVTVESAGIGKPYEPEPAWAVRGVIVLTMGVHDHDLRLPAEEYAKLAKGPLGGYTTLGAPDRDKYYFRRAILGVDRALNYVALRPDYDGKHLVVSGSSQGGGFALIMAGLNKRVTAATGGVPALCDHAGYLAERGPGWPGLVRSLPADQREATLKMSAYFDAVNFARKITCPVLLSAGFVDTTCSPSSVYAAYNEIRSPKRMFNGPLIGHGWASDFSSYHSRWLAGQLGISAVIEPTVK